MQHAPRSAKNIVCATTTPNQRLLVNESGIERDRDHRETTTGESGQTLLIRKACVRTAKAKSRGAFGSNSQEGNTYFKFNVCLAIFKLNTVCALTMMIRF